MGDRRAETALHDISALFRLGVASGMSDGQLLDQFALQSDTESQLAFEAIVRRHGPMVHGVCLRVLGDYHAAEDAFQATFMVLAVKSRSIRKRESVGPWLHGVAVRIARRKLVLGRRSRGQPMTMVGLAAPADRDPATSDLGRVLDEELGRLPDKYRLPVVLCYLEGQTQDEAARILGWTKGTVSGRLARAKDLLRHRLTRRGVAAPAGLLAATLTSTTAKAAVPPYLVRPTVRAAMSAILGGAETGLVTGQAAALARETLKAMLLGRIGRLSAQVCLLGTCAAALATPMLRPGPAIPQRQNRAGLSAAAARGADRSSIDARTARFDRIGDPLPPRASLRLGTIQRRHTREVVGIDFARDGKSAISAQADGLVRFWGPETGRQLHAFDVLAGAPTQDKSLRAIASSPDSDLMAAVGFALDPVRRRMVQHVWIWDRKTDQMRREIAVPTLDLFCVAFSPDGQALATGGFAGEVQLWDVASGDCLKSFKLGNSSVHSVCFTPDGKIVAACEQGKGTRLYDLAQGRETFLPDSRCTQNAPVFSGDGRWMAVNALGNEMVLWDRRTGEKHLTTTGGAVKFAPDSRALATFDLGAGALRVIDPGTGDELWTIELGWGPTSGGLAFSPDGGTIIADRGGALRFFEAKSGRERFGSPEAHQGAVNVVLYTPDGHSILTAGDDGSVRQWDAATARQLRVFPHDGRIHALAVSDDGRSFATAVQGPRASVSVWNLATGVRRRQWPETDGVDSTRALAFSSDGDTLLALGMDRGLRMLEIATGAEGEVEPLEFSQDQGDIFNTSTSRGVFSPGNEFLAITTSTSVHVADLKTGAPWLSAPGLGLAFARGRLVIASPGKPEMSQLADGSFRTQGPVADGIEVVDFATRTTTRIEIHPEKVAALAVSPDGKAIAMAYGWIDPKVRVYETETGRETASFVCPARVNHPGALAFSPDGRSLAAGLVDTTVVIWHLRDIQ